MFRKLSFVICLVLLLTLTVGIVQAQEGQGPPRPTPTNVPPAGSGSGSGSGTTSSPNILEAAASKGSIRGTVYHDQNADGYCAGEPALAGVPIKFVSGDGKTSVYLQSGENGTYGLVAAGLGTWTVSAEPGAGKVVTSKNPLQTYIGEDSNLALGVDFCVAIGNYTGFPGVGVPGGGTVILPTAGAPIAPVLLITAVTGLSLILAGASIELSRRRKTQAPKI